MIDQKSGRILRLTLLSLILAVLAIVNVEKLNGPIIMPDETGYWAAGAYFAGQDWTGVMRICPYYGIGYGIVLAPIMVLFHDPITVYHVAIVENAVLWIGCFWLLRYLTKAFFPNISALRCDMICFAVNVFAPYLYDTQTTYVESCLIFVFLVICVSLTSVARKPSYIMMVILGVSVVFSFALHQRTLGVAIALIVSLVLMLVRHKIKVRHIIVFFAVLILSYMAFTLIKDNVIANVYQNSSTVTYNDFPQQTDKLAKIFSLDGFRHLLMNCIGRVMYLGAASLLLVFWGSFYAARDIIYGLGIKKKYEMNVNHSLEKFVEVKIFIVLCVLAAVGISAIFMIESERLDHIIYGRYSEYTIGPILVIGIVYLFKSGKQTGKLFLFALLQAGLAVATYLYMQEVDYKEFGPYAISGVYGCPSLPGLDQKAQFTIWVSLLAVIVSFIAFVLIANWKKKKIYGVLGLAVISLTWIGLGFSASERSLYAQSEIEREWYEFAQETKEVVGDDDAYYILDDDEHNTSAYWNMYRLKFFLPNTNIVGLSSEEFETIENPQYLLLHSTSRAYQRGVDSNYVKVLYMGPFRLFASVDSNYVYGDYWKTKVSADLSNFELSSSSKFELQENKQVTGIIANATTEEGQIAIYGPYITLPTGQYRVTYTIELISAPKNITELGVCDVSAEGGTILTQEPLTKDDFLNGSVQQVVLDVNTGISELENAEFRLYVEPGVQFRVTDISYQCVSLERQAMLPSSEDYSMLRSILDSDPDSLPVRVVVDDGMEPLISCTQLKEALADTGRSVSIVKRSEVRHTPAVLLVPVDDTDLLFDLLPNFTVLVRMDEYALLVPSGYSVETAYRDVGGRPMSEGNQLNLRYFQGSGTSNYGNLAVNVPAGTYELRYTVEVNGTPLWYELGSISVSGGKTSVTEALTADLFGNGYGTYENSQMMTLENDGQIRVGVSTHSGVDVIGLEAYLTRIE